MNKRPIKAYFLALYLFLIISGCFANLNTPEASAKINQSNDLYTFQFLHYFGGSSLDYAENMAFDSNNNIIIAGVTRSSDFNLTTSPSDQLTSKPYRYFISKFTPDGSQLIFSTLVGSTTSPVDQMEYVIDILVDSDDNIIFSFTTNDADLPTFQNSFDKTYNGDSDLYIGKLSSDGSELLSSTYFGGNSSDLMFKKSSHFDSTGNLIIAATSASVDLPTTNNAFDQTQNGKQDVFIVKFKPDFSGILFSTFLGGNSNEVGVLSLIDPDNNIHITGSLASSNFPVTANGLNTSSNGGDGQDFTQDAFYSILFNDGSTLLYSTYLGGNSNEFVNGFNFDNVYNPIIALNTGSSNYPVTNDAYDKSYNGGDYECSCNQGDTGLTKLSKNGTKILYSTFLGGGALDYPHAGVVLDSKNNYYIGGITHSLDFPVTTDIFSGITRTNENTYLSIFQANGSLLYSTLIGGNNKDRMRDMLLDNDNNIYIFGDTSSSNLPITDHSIQDGNNGYSDIFFGKLVSSDSLNSSENSSDSNSSSSNTNTSPMGSFEISTIAIMIFTLKRITSKKKQHRS